MLNLDVFLWSRCLPHKLLLYCTYSLYSSISFATPLGTFGFVSLGFNASCAHKNLTPGRQGFLVSPRASAQWITAPLWDRLWMWAALPRGVQCTACPAGSGGPTSAHSAGALEIILALTTKSKAAQCHPWSHENGGEAGWWSKRNCVPSSKGDPLEVCHCEAHYEFLQLKSSNWISSLDRWVQPPVSSMNRND